MEGDDHVGLLTGERGEGAMAKVNEVRQVRALHERFASVLEAA